MNFEKFTIKAQEVIQGAVNTAQNAHQQAIEPIHLLLAPIAKAPDVTNYLFQKLGVNGAQIQTLAQQEIHHLPRVEGGQPYLSNDSNKVLNKAEDIARSMGDEFTSVEPILLALLQVNSTASRILKDAGCTTDEMLKAVKELRQGQSVQTQSGDDNYQALSKYATDLPMLPVRASSIL